jgi:hypothetical protein
MTGGIPLTNYQIRCIRHFCAVFTVLLALIFLGANIYNSFIKKGITVKKDAYVMRNGYPFFVSQKDYVALVKSYPHNPGVKITIHTLREGESLWNVCQLYGISIDTLKRQSLSSTCGKRIWNWFSAEERGALPSTNITECGA